MALHVLFTFRMTQYAQSSLATLPSVLLFGAESPARSRLHSILVNTRFRTLACARLRDALDLLPLASVVVVHPPLEDCNWEELRAQAEAVARPPELVQITTDSRESASEELHPAVRFALHTSWPGTDVTEFVRNAHHRWQHRGVANPEAAATSVRFGMSWALGASRPRSRHVEQVGEKRQHCAISDNETSAA